MKRWLHRSGVDTDHLGVLQHRDDPTIRLCSERRAQKALDTALDDLAAARAAILVACLDLQGARLCRCEELGQKLDDVVAYWERFVVGADVRVSPYRRAHRLA
jgi:hypothetical protein